MHFKFLLYLQSLIEDNGLNFENGWKSIPAQAGIFKIFLYVSYLISIPIISNFQKNPFLGRCIFLCIFLAAAWVFLYNFWQFWNFRPNIPTLHCLKCHEIFTVCKKENIVDIVRNHRSFFYRGRGARAPPNFQKYLKQYITWLKVVHLFDQNRSVLDTNPLKCISVLGSIVEFNQCIHLVPPSKRGWRYAYVRH